MAHPHLRPGPPSCVVSFARPLCISPYRRSLVFFVEHSTFWCRGLEEGHDRPSNDERRWCNRSWIWGWPFYGWPIGHIIWVSLKISRTPQNLKDSHHVPLNIAIVEAHSIFHSTTSRVTLLDFPAIASSLSWINFPLPKNFLTSDILIG